MLTDALLMTHCLVFLQFTHHSVTGEKELFYVYSLQCWSLALLLSV